MEEFDQSDNDYIQQQIDFIQSASEAINGNRESLEKLYLYKKSMLNQWGPPPSIPEETTDSVLYIEDDRGNELYRRIRPISHIMDSDMVLYDPVTTSERVQRKVDWLWVGHYEMWQWINLVSFGYGLSDSYEISRICEGIQNKKFVRQVKVTKRQLYRHVSDAEAIWSCLESRISPDDFRSRREENEWLALTHSPPLEISRSSGKYKKGHSARKSSTKKHLSRLEKDKVLIQTIEGLYNPQTRFFDEGGNICIVMKDQDDVLKLSGIAKKVTSPNGQIVGTILPAKDESRLMKYEIGVDREWNINSTGHSFEERLRKLELLTSEKAADTILFIVDWDEIFNSNDNGESVPFWSELLNRALNMGYWNKIQIMILAYNKKFNTFPKQIATPLGYTLNERHTNTEMVIYRLRYNSS